MTKDHEALFYIKEKDKKVRCQLCPNLCKIAPGEVGRCNVRGNQNGKLYALNYGLTHTGAKDPIEKKPLYHFLPGTCAYSFGTVGCNLHCQFCQNWHTSRGSPDDAGWRFSRLSPKKAAEGAERSGCPSVAYTYNEPIVWYEWVLDTAKIVKEKGLKNILVTNGYIMPEPLEKILPYIDAANVDVKGDDEFYRKLCKVSHQEAVLRTCETMKEKGVHLEITNLIIPTMNDSEEQIKSLIDWVVNKLGTEVPLHFSRYFPHYKLKISQTPVKTIIKAREMALEAGMKYVYLGNVRSNDADSTFCKTCGELLIHRQGYSVRMGNISDEMKCNKCQTFADILC